MTRRWLGIVVSVVVLGGCGATSSAPPASVGSIQTAAVTPAPAAESTPTPMPTSTSQPTASPAPTPDTSGVATRIVITSLKIDLPVVELPKTGLPYCGVAMWWSADNQFVSPGLPGAAYLLAYARKGMFLALLDASLVNDGSAMIGKKVEVYTSADWLFTYSISAVHRHVPFGIAASLPLAATDPELWLQTSEGSGTQPRLMVQATLVGAHPASHATAQPAPKIVVCK